MNERRRTTLALLAELLIPAADGFPSGRDAGVAQAGVDRVLTALPELQAPLAAALDRVDGLAAEAALAGLHGEPDGESIVQLVVAGAYLTEPAVLSRLGYRGRAASPVRDDLDNEVVELLEQLLEREAVSP